MAALFGNILAQEAPRQETDRSVTDLGRAAGGTDIAADTAKKTLFAQPA